MNSSSNDRLPVVLYSIPASFQRVAKNASNKTHYRIDFVDLIKEALVHDLKDYCRIIYDKKKDHDLRLEHHARKDTPATIDYKQNYLAPFFYFGAGGYSGWARSIVNADLTRTDTRSIDEADRIYRERIEPLHGESRFKQPNPIESDIPNRFLLVATQVEKDTVMHLKYVETREMIDRAFAAAQYLGVPLVIKNHPLEKRNYSIIRYSKAMANRHDSVFRSEGDISGLIARSHGVCVVNSGVGFEALCHLKPVFTFGKADYHQATFENLSARRIADTLQRSMGRSRFLKTFLANYLDQIVDVRYTDESRQKIVTKVKSKLASL
jgi:hypothetical protein